MKADTPIELASLQQMSSEEIDTLLSQIRERRLRPVREYEEMLALKDSARKEQLLKQWIRHTEMFAKELSQLDAKILKIEDRAIKMRALKMEMGV